MLTKPLLRLFAGLGLMVVLAACGGGGGGGGSTSTTPPAASYTVTAVAGTGTTLTPATQTVSSGQKATLKVDLLAGYSNLVVTGGGGTLDGSTYTTGPITANTMVTASATPVVTHTVSITLGAGIQTPSTSITVNDGVSVTIPFTLDAGYTNLVVTGGTGTLSGLSYTLTNVTANVSLTASATAPVVTHTVSITLGAGVHTPSTSITVNDGANVTIPFTLDAGYTNLVVTGGTGTLSGLSYTLTNVTAKVSLTASATAPVVTHTVSIALGAGVHTPSTSITVNDGANVTIPFTLDAGYTNLVVTGGTGTLSGLSYTLTNVKSNVALTASATPISYTVTAVAGTGTTLTPATQTVAYGQTATFTVGLQTGYSNLVVSGGSGTLSGTTYTTGPITANTTISASATPISYTVTAVAGTGTTLTPATQTVPYGQTTTFTVGLQTGYSNLVVTGGAGTLSGTTYTTGPITANTTITASATPISYTVTAVAGTGTTITPATQTVPYGQTASFTVGLQTGYSNLVVTGGGGTLSGTTYTTGPISANTTITASATPISYTVTAVAGTGTTITPATQTVAYGQTATFTVGLQTGYSNLVVTGGAGTLSGTTYTTGPISANTTITASATPISYTVTAVAGTGTTLTPAMQTVAYGQTASFTVGLQTGYSSLVVTGGAGTLSGTTYTTGPISANTTITASATPISYTVTAVAGTGTTITPATQTVAYGQTTTFTVGLQTGYSNLVVSGGSGTLSGTTYTTGPITGDTTVTTSATPISYTVTAVAGTGTTITPATQTVAYGQAASFTVGLQTGYTNLVVTGGAGTLSGTTYTTGPITADTTITTSATANPVYYTVTANAGPGTTLTPASVQVADGSTVTFTGSLLTGYHTLVISGAGGTQNGASFTTGPIHADASVTSSATPNAATHTITIILATGVHTPSTTVTVNDGSDITIPFTLDAGFADFMVNSVPASLNYTLTNVTSDLTLLTSAWLPPTVYTVTLNAGPGIILPSPTVSVQNGYSVSINYELELGYRDPVASGLGAMTYLRSVRTYYLTSDAIHADGQISISASVDDRYALQYIRSSDNALFLSEFNTKPITIEVRAAGNGFTLFAEYNASTFGTLPYEIVKEQLYDDGTHGDKVAKDGIYTATFTLNPPALTRYHDHSVEWMRIDVFAYDSSGNKITSIIDMGTDINIGVIDPAYSAISTQVASDMYASTNSINVVVPNLGTSFTYVLGSSGVWPSSPITKRIYQIYPDAFDVIAIIFVGNTRAYYGFTGNWPNTNLVKITETGLGIPQQDLTSDYGSAGKLQSVLSLDNDIAGMSFLHEFGHRWSFYLANSSLCLADSSGVHPTSPTTLLGQMGNSNYLSEQPSGDFLVTSTPDGGNESGRKYADWELYLMGFLSPVSVAPERFVLSPTVPKSSGTIIPRANTDLIPISGPSGSQSVVGIYGDRIPLAADSQHAFKVLFVAVSDRPLTLAETSMINRNAVYFGSMIEGRDIVNPLFPNFLTMPTFWSATKYLGTMDTTVPAPK